MIQRSNELRKKYLPLALFLKKAGLKIKTAIVRRKAVEYFRIDEMKSLLEKKEKEIQAAGLTVLAKES